MKLIKADTTFDLSQPSIGHICAEHISILALDDVTWSSVFGGDISIRWVHHAAAAPTCWLLLSPSLGVSQPRTVTVALAQTPQAANAGCGGATDPPGWAAALIRRRGAKVRVPTLLRLVQWALGALEPAAECFFDVELRIVCTKLLPTHCPPPPSKTPPHTHMPTPHPPTLRLTKKTPLVYNMPTLTFSTTSRRRVPVAGSGYQPQKL